MNKMGTHIANDPRELALRNAVYDCIFNIEQKQTLKIDTELQSSI
jgi:hypothetical protein